MIRLALAAAVLLALPAVAQQGRTPPVLQATDQDEFAGLSGQWLIDAGARAKLADGQPPADPNAAKVFVDFDGAVYWNKRDVSRAGFRTAVANHARDNPGAPIWVEWHRFARREVARDVVAAINATGVAPLIVPAVEGVSIRPAPPPDLPPVRPKVDGAALARMMAESYPRAAVRDRRQGNVTVVMCVGADGRVRDVRVAKSSGHADLDEATVKGIASVKFSPARDASGKAVDWCDPPYAVSVGWRIP
jgi:TonB family protein